MALMYACRDIVVLLNRGLEWCLLFLECGQSQYLRENTLLLTSYDS